MEKKSRNGQKGTENRDITLDLRDLRIVGVGNESEGEATASMQRNYLGSLANFGTLQRQKSEQKYQIFQISAPQNLGFNYAHNIHETMV